MPFMPGMFRSEEMTQCQLFLQTEASYACVAELGELGIVQFKDLNHDVNAFQRKFVTEVRRCEEMERKLRYIEKEVLKDKMRIPRLHDNPPTPPPKDMAEMEAIFEKVESELREVNTNAEALKRNFLELTELREVLLKSNVLFGTTGERSFVTEAQEHLVETDRAPGAVQLGFVAGVIQREKCFNFEKIMKRCTRNNSYFQSLTIDESLTDPATGDPIFKNVFIVFFQGEQLKNIVHKVCDGFKVSLYPCPEQQREREEMLQGINTRLDDLKMVLNQTEEHRHRVLVGSQKELRLWITKVEKIKAVYHILNMFNFDVSHNSLIAECWTPLNSLDLLRSALKKGEKASGSHIPGVIHPMNSSETPPTFFRTNRFTKGFQNIVDAYGVAEYMEVNPTPYTIISFPFLFAVMFGDTGHGALMFAFGLWMVIMEKSLMKQKSDNEIWNTFFGGRYIITLMGVFSIYTGMIYNDCYSKAFNIFGSAWYPNYTEGDLQSHTLILNPEHLFRQGTPYEFGLDPIWAVAFNKITFMNSFKMKSAVIMGITQMLFGVCLSVFNNVHFRKPLDFFCEFIPEFIFLMSLFGYLVAIIYYKWVTFTPFQSACAPSLLIQYINMFMFKYSYEGGDPNCDPQRLFYPNQQIIQTILVVLAAISAPWLLVIKPFVLRHQHNRRAKAMLYLGSCSTDALLPNEHSQEQSNGKPSKGQVNAGADKVEADIELGPMAAREKPSAGRKQEGEAAETAESMQGASAGHGSNGDFAGPTQRQAGPFPKGTRGMEGPAGDGGVQLLFIKSTGGGPNSEQPGSSVEAAHGETRVQLAHEEKEEEFDFSEIFIHQAIHTIEFCLGCISHTASYLRLWALSLAHAQLSEVLWNMVFRMATKMGSQLYVGGIFIAVLWYAWGVLTIAVLLMMEGLSAFLHTLRLHWVEFQSKFYHGTGYQFEPFSFKPILDMDSLQDG